MGGCECSLSTWKQLAAYWLRDMEGEGLPLLSGLKVHGDEGCGDGGGSYGYSDEESEDDKKGKKMMVKCCQSHN